MKTAVQVAVTGYMSVLYCSLEVIVRSFEDILLLLKRPVLSAEGILLLYENNNCLFWIYCIVILGRLLHSAMQI